MGKWQRPSRKSISRILSVYGETVPAASSCVGLNNVGVRRESGVLVSVHLSFLDVLRRNEGNRSRNESFCGAVWVGPTVEHGAQQNRHLDVIKSSLAGFLCRRCRAHGGSVPLAISSLKPEQSSASSREDGAPRRLIISLTACWRDCLMKYDRNRRAPWK